MRLGGKYLRTLGPGLEVEIVEPGLVETLRLSLIDAETSHVDPGLLLKLLGNQESDRFQIKLHSAHSTIPVLGLQRSLPATVGNFKKCATDQAKYHDGPEQDREGISFLAPPGSSALEISAS
jgi:hypothetical protein